MSNPTSLLAYPDVKIAFERARLSRAGIKVTFPTEREAFHFKGRCNSYRVLDRKENLKIYLEPASTLHGRSIYDHLRISQIKNDVLIIPVTLSEGSMADLE